MPAGPRRLAAVVLRAGVTLVLLAVAAWLCVEAAPGAPAEAAARASGVLPADATRLSPDLRRRIVREAAARHGLDRPAPARLARFVAGLPRADLGRSWRDGETVRGHLARAVPVTARLVLAALAAAYLVGLIGALGAALRPGGAGDWLIGGAAAVAVAVPPAWAAVLALRAFAGGRPFSLLPPQGGGSAAAAVLPVACMTYVAAALVARHGRAALLEAQRQPFVLAARARGASRGRALVIHALAAAGAQLTGLAGLLVPGLIGAAVVVERAFDLRGLGALLVDATAAGDAPVVVGAVLAAGGLVALGTIAADAIAAAVDPRRREGGGR